MTKTKKAACNCCSSHTPNVHEVLGSQDTPIISEFVHGSKLAAGAFVAMFIFLSLGVVIFGW